MVCLKSISFDAYIITSALSSKPAEFFVEKDLGKQPTVVVTGFPLQGNALSKR
jgi:hypothetical protein